MAFEIQASLPPLPRIHVLLVDGEVVIRAGLRVLIDSWPTVQVIEDVETLVEALKTMEAGDAAGALKPDVIVWSHPGGSEECLGDLRDLIQGAGRIPVVLLTGSQDPHEGALAVQAGTKWIVFKKHAAIELRRALEGAYAGREWGAEFAVATRTAQMYRRSGESDKSWSVAGQALTARERQVAVLVGEGCTNRQAGKRLGITEITVRHHLTSIFNKIRIANRFELVAWLYRNGVLRPKELV